MKLWEKKSRTTLSYTGRLCAVRQVEQSLASRSFAESCWERYAAGASGEGCNEDRVYESRVLEKPTVVGVGRVEEEEERRSWMWRNEVWFKRTINDLWRSMADLLE